MKDAHAQAKVFFCVIPSSIYFSFERKRFFLSKQKNLCRGASDPEKGRKKLFFTTSEREETKGKQEKCMSDQSWL